MAHYLLALRVSGRGVQGLTKVLINVRRLCGSAQPGWVQGMSAKGVCVDIRCVLEVRGRKGEGGQGGEERQLGVEGRGGTVKVERKDNRG